MKCLVSWCQDDGLDGGALPGLCVDHRDQTLGKQREAAEVVERDRWPRGFVNPAEMAVLAKANPRAIWAPTNGPNGEPGYVEVAVTSTTRATVASGAPASPDTFTASDYARPPEVTFKPLSWFLSQQCVRCGVRSGEVCEQMPIIEKGGKTFGLLPQKALLCNACVLTIERSHVSVSTG